MSINNLKVYRSRYPSVQVSVGSPSSDIRYQNPDPTTISAKVKSIVQDTAQNLSEIHYLDLNVDWTPPTGLATVLDGAGSDIDTFYTSTEITGNWDVATDVNSNISHYEMSVGTSPGDSNTVAWTNVGNVINHTLTGLNLNGGTIYYVNVRAVNNAQLASPIISSDGQFLDSDASINENELLPFSVYPNPFVNHLQIDFNLNIKDVSISLYNVNGQKIQNQKLEQTNELSYKLEVTNSLADGMYILEIRSKSDVWKVKLIKK
jgi:hypothetical protein